ncbi:MAG TPA: hypothetical protein PLP11_00640 [Bacteroidales bacterium]|nr:hypothetical protein [Bacteroidales bacterium]
MKNVYLLIAISLMLLTVPGALFAQGVAINTDGAAAHASAMLDVQSTNKGLLVPRIANWASNPANPATGLMIFNLVGDGTNGPGFYYYTGSSWVKMFAGGTNDYILNQVATDQTAGFRISGNGYIGSNLGVGTTSPLGRIHTNIGSGAVTATTYALYSQNQATNTTTDGVNKFGGYFVSQGAFTGGSGAATNNYGIYTVATGADNNYGVWASSGTAIYGVGTVYGVYGQTSTNNGYGGYFSNTATGTGTQYALRAQASGGTGTGTKFGVYALVNGSATTNYAIYGNASGGTTNWAGYFMGNTYISTNLGIGTTSPAANIDNGGTTAGGALRTVFARQSEGNSTGSGTFLGVRAWETQNTSYGGKMFSIENTFYGQLNSSIEFYRGSSTTGGYMTFTSNNGTERMRIDPSGYVGIGTTAPSTQLHTTGGVRFQTLAGTGSRIVYADASGNLSAASAAGSGLVSGSGTTNYVSKWTPNGNTLGNSQIYDNGTAVGIGTSAPSHLFTIQGSSASTTYLNVGGTSNGSLSARHIRGKNAGDANPGDLYLQYYEANSIYMAYGGGNVGIGNTAASYKLDVTGNGRFTTDLRSQTFGIQNTSNSTGYGISLYNGPTAGAPTYGIMFAGTGTFGTHGYVTSDWATYFTMNDNTARGWVFRRNLTNVASISGGGNLSIAGRIRVGDNAQTEMYSNSNRVKFRSENIDGVAEFASYGLYLPRTEQTYNLYVAGKVKIGHGEAGYLDINDVNTRIAEGGSNSIRLQTNYGYTDFGPQNADWSHFSTDRPRYYFNKGITVDEGLIGSYNEDLQLQTSGNTRVTVLNSNGNVGIATASPAYGKLQIQHEGDANANEWGTHAIMIRDSDHALYMGADTETRCGYIRSTDIGTAQSNLSLNPSGGNVGIGTTSPLHKLDVTGNQATGWGTGLGHFINNAISNDVAGVYGSTNNTPYYGFGGYFLGGFIGVRGESTLEGNYAYGVYGQAYGNYGYGVYGVAYGNSIAYGVYSSGDFTCTGTKSATVKTEEGPKELYCQESPENWFEDFGSGVINNGKAVVNIKQDYLMTVTISEQHSMKVFITPNGQMGNWWVEKKEDSFIVYAPDAQNGTEFDFRVVAKRKGYEDIRLKDAPGAYTDKFLYPTVNDVPARYREDWLKLNR